MEAEDSNFLLTIYRDGSNQQITDYHTLYKYDNLVSTLVDTFPDSAYSTGFQVISDSEEFYHEALNNLKVWETFRTASKWARLNGLCCVLIGTSGRLDVPLKPTQNVQALKIYSLSTDTDIDTEFIKIGTEEIHRSRLLFFKGKELLSDSTGEVKTTYTSILDGLIEVLMKYREIPSLALKLIKTCNQVVLATKGLSAGIRNDILTNSNVKRKEIQSRLTSLDEGRNINSMMLIDLENETLDKTSLNISGVEKQVEVLENQLAIRSGYPKHILFGDAQMSALGSGQIAQLIQRMLWASEVSKWIDNNWTEGIEKITRQLQTSLTLRDFEINIPLALVLSDQEVAEINQKQVEILEKILAFYPMEFDQIKEYIEQHFKLINLPDVSNVTLQLQKKRQQDQLNATAEPVTVPNEEVKDSIYEDMNQLTVVNSQDVDQVMEKIGENS